MDIFFEDVTFVYQQNTPFEHVALKNLSFHIKKGSYVAIIGHTGSGKSTLIQHLNGLVLPTKGKVKVGEDFELSRERKLDNIKSLRKQVGVVFQYPEHQLFEETVGQDIAFGPKNFGVPLEEIDELVEQSLEAVQLDRSFLTRSPFDLSGGQMRRVAIASVLASNPDVLVLDEPTAGLDPYGRKEMMKLFKQLHDEKQLTTILVTHHMEDALRYADHVLILNKGKKYMEGCPLDVFSKDKQLEKIHLDVPEQIRFLNAFQKRFNIEIPFYNQSTEQLAKEVALSLKEAAKK